jgi:RNA polymerase subunit RPABC4/transcription elongation factor Spt4
VSPATCRRCSEILNANANFCWSCGAPQHDATTPDTVAVPIVEAGTSSNTEPVVAPTTCPVDTLVVVSGARKTDSIEMTKEVSSVGRHEDSDIVLDDVSVSRHHGLFTRTASGRITVRDLNSLNGTYVNGARVEESVLRNGDEIQIGKFKLVFWSAS